LLSLWLTVSTINPSAVSHLTAVQYHLLGWEPDMPLVKSKSPEAFRKNVKAEVAAGKPVAQSVAIAYAVKRAAAKAPAAKRPK